MRPLCSSMLVSLGTKVSTMAADNGCQPAHQNKSCSLSTILEENVANQHNKVKDTVYGLNIQRQCCQPAHQNDARPLQTEALRNSCRLAHHNQCFFFRWNIGLATPKTIYVHYLKSTFQGQSIQKNISFNFENRSADHNVAYACFMNWRLTKNAGNLHIKKMHTLF